MQANDYVILVDKNGNNLINKDGAIITAGKISAHLNCELHRAFSIFILNSKGDILLQQRALNKYHSGGLWSNTCCSHLMLGESIVMAGRRRLKEEMGIDCDLSEFANFVYKCRVSDNMFEYEFNHVLIGFCNNDPIPNKAEVANWSWRGFYSLILDLKKESSKYTSWFQLLAPKVYFLLRERAIL